MQRLHVMLIPLNCLYLIDTLRYLAFFYQSTPSCLKVVGGVGWVAHVILESAQGPNPSFFLFI